jgi:hypothetical protein
MSTYSRTLFCDSYLLLPYTTLTLNLLTTTIVAPPSNAGKWQMGFNSAFKGLTRHYSRASLVWDLTQSRLEVTDVSRQPIGSIFKSQAVRVDIPKSNRHFWVSLVGLLDL